MYSQESSSATNESHALARCLSCWHPSFLAEASTRTAGGADQLLAARSCLSGGLANGREQRLGGATLLHTREPLGPPAPVHVSARRQGCSASRRRVARDHPMPRS